MSTVAIICEYDPFHKGHQKQIDIIREHFGPDTTVISLMSGSVVQRGRLSVYPKHLRAEAAIRCGSDLVLELPCPYCCSSAEFFATGAVKLLDSLGKIDFLAFGSECGDIEALTEAARIISSEEYKTKIKEADNNLSHIKTASEIFTSLGGKSFPEKPNDILGIEYISALMLNKSKIVPFTYKRENGYSATESRKALISGGEPAEHIPSEALSVFGRASLTDVRPYEAIALHTLRTTDSDTLSSFSSMNGGVAGLIKKSSEDVTSLDELISSCVNKSYTASRIRRAVLSSILKIKEGNLREAPLFTNLLASNTRGREFLKRIKKASSLNIVTKPADGRLLPEKAKTQFELSLSADKLMALCRSEGSSSVLKKSPVVL